MKVRKKLIEVALPLDAINKASVREKSIRHGHPSTLHLWWARRPLAVARAVIFAQLVDDPSANPDLFPKEAEEKERQRLFGVIEELVKWENTTNESVLQQARDEIWQSWRRACADNSDHPRAKELFDRNILPAFHDPFAGGGSLPLEAQRLGLEAHASDLNPVAVLINKAMIEIPPKFAGRPPVNPESRSEKRLVSRGWRCAQGLAEDVRYYGRWMRDKAEKRIGHLYPKIHVTADLARNRPDLSPYLDRELTVIAWLWARTVKSPNPAFAGVNVPLASSFILSRKQGKEAYVEPVIEDGEYRFTVRADTPPDAAKSGTKLSRGANFRCLMSGAPMSGDYIKAQGMAGRMGARLMSIVAQGDHERIYLAPCAEHEEAAQRVALPKWKPQVSISGSTQYLGVKPYGIERFDQLFTNRQLLALNTLSELVGDAMAHVRRDALRAGLPDDDLPIRDGGTGAMAYAESVAMYLGLALSRLSDICNVLCGWEISKTQVRHLFVRQAIPMLWDFAENNAFGDAAGDYMVSLRSMARALEGMPTLVPGAASQASAQEQSTSVNKLISTDPPYYDNVPYADLSDFFYVWLRRSLSPLFPDLFATLAVPKAEELVAFQYRHSSKAAAEAFFLDSMTQSLGRLSEQAHPDFPVTVFYAFKQSEKRGEAGTASTGWEAFLDGLIRSGFSITGTWPMRTELGNRMRSRGSNALASSIVLACRPRPPRAPSATRREFQDALRAELPEAVAHMQQFNIAPVDLAQSSIGPGMAIFTRYSTVLNADGTKMSVGNALALINATLDDVMAEQDGAFDADSRWALAWFEQSGHDEGEYGVAETLSMAKNTSVEGLVRAGIVEARRGTVRILRASELDADWDPATDARLTVWEMTQHLIRAIASGENAAATVAAKLGVRAEAARDLAYRLYLISERKRRPADALQYNSLVQSWPEIARLARQRPKPTQMAMPSQAEDGS